MSGILELLGLRETQVTPQMVTKAQQKAIDAIALLDHFAADDPVADQAKDALSDRLGHVAGTLDAQRTDILAIAGDAATALKDAKQREIVDLAATDVGRGILDHRVGAMHGKAKTDDDKAFVQAALKAR
jgi:hypothetical protein